MLGLTPNQLSRNLLADWHIHISSCLVYAYTFLNLLPYLIKQRQEWSLLAYENNQADHLVIWNISQENISYLTNMINGE